MLYVVIELNEGLNDIMCLFKLGIGIKIVSQLLLKYSFFFAKLTDTVGAKK